MSPPCWLNGHLLPLDQARIDPTDRGFTLADGVFETIAVRAGRPAHLSRHLARLHTGAAVLALDCPWPHATIAEAVAALIAASAAPDGVIRITLTRGPAPRGLLPPTAADATLLMLWSAASVPPGPATLIICRTTTRHQASPLARIKSLNYGDAILARLDAARAGADDAVLLNTRGTVAEATAATVFIHAAGRLLTPPVSDGALPGIARALLLAHAAAQEATLTEADLHQADAIILANSLHLRQVARLEHRSFAPAPALLTALRAAAA